MCSRFQLNHGTRLVICTLKLHRVKINRGGGAHPENANMDPIFKFSDFQKKILVDFDPMELN